MQLQQAISAYHGVGTRKRYNAESTGRTVRTVGQQYYTNSQGQQQRKQHDNRDGLKNVQWVGYSVQGFLGKPSI